MFQNATITILHVLRSKNVPTMPIVLSGWCSENEHSCRVCVCVECACVWSVRVCEMCVCFMGDGVRVR